MPLVAGQRIGAYEVVAPLGAGGMGEVYRARDTRLDREVAIKILPAAFAADVERLARFEREAKTLASLNHPNIAQIYGIEQMPEAAGSALVMELVDGEDLSERIARGPIPVAEALPIARQIAAALEAAHERGIVHRDLKPANIKVRDDGAVKVLDFGLAKAIDPAGASSSELMNSPTITSPATQLGMIIGTAAYMAPEQAKGRAIDRRADVWAFGVVLFEMLTGKRVFKGDDISDVLASVLKDTPAHDALPADTPHPIRRLLRRCLEKDHVRRLDSMAAARMEIDEALGSADSFEPAAAGGMSFGRAAAAIAATSIAAALIGGAAVWRVMKPEPAPVHRLLISPRTGSLLAVETNHQDVVISRDGRQVLYWSQNPNGANELVVRDLGQFESRIVDAGPEARGMFLSPDARWIGFQDGSPAGAGASLLKIPAEGGIPQRLASIDGNLRGASWDGDVIVYATARTRTGLQRVAGSGGPPEVLTLPKSEDGEVDHLWPHVLPGGRYVLFVIRRLAPATSDVALLDLRDNTWRVLVKDGTMPRYANSGQILYASRGLLLAIPFDPERGALTGEPRRVVEGVLTKESGAASYDVSRTGTLIYMPGSSLSPALGIAAVDRQGKVTSLPIEARQYRGIRVSPDGRKLAVTIEEDGTSGAWVVDLERQTLSRLTPPAIGVGNPTWSPDGRFIAFTRSVDLSAADGASIFVIAASGTGEARQLTSTPARVRQLPTSWSSDGRHLIFTQGSEGADIMRVDLTSKEVSPLLTGPSNETGGALSPDGRWLAYHSDETGRNEVYIRPYPKVQDEKIQVTSNGGRAPMWRVDQRELVWLDRAGDPVSVTVSSSGGTLALGKPARIAALEETGAASAMAMMPDASRFLFTSRPRDTIIGSEYRVVLNWFEELKARVK